jgi:hypothetical protein
VGDSTRRWPRIGLALKVRMQFEDVWDAADSLTVNISRQGLFVRMNPPKPVGTHIRLELRLKTGERFELAGTIVRAVAAGEAPTQSPTVGPGVGVDLLQSSPGWEEFVERLERRRADGKDAVDVDLDF